MVNDFTVTETVEEEVETITQEVEDTAAKRGRGRPAGSLNKSNGTDALKTEVEDLKKTVERLEYLVQENLATAASHTVTIDSSVLDGDTERRLTILQAWVEMFHHFLNTGRITNSVDGAAEAALEDVMTRLPENASFIDYPPLYENTTE